MTQSRRLCTGSVEFQVPCPAAAISARKPCQRAVHPCLCPSLPGFVCEHTIFSAVVPRTCVYLQIPPPRFISSKMGRALHRFHTIFWSFSHPFNLAFFSSFFPGGVIVEASDLKFPPTRAPTWTHEPLHCVGGWKDKNCDMDECDYVIGDNNCHHFATCKNTAGSYICQHQRVRLPPRQLRLRPDRRRQQLGQGPLHVHRRR